MIAKCPGCGAPSTPGAFVCRYCNSPLSGPPREQPTATAGHGGRAVGFAVGLTVVMGTISAAGVWATSRATVPGASGGGGGLLGSLTPRASPNGLLAAIPNASGGDDLLVHFYHDDRYHLARLDGLGLTKLWESEHGEKVSTDAVVTTPNAAILAEGERLRAYDLGDGHQLWNVGLVADLQWGDNLRLVGDTVVAWQKDRSLQAFDAASGAARWTRKTEKAGDQLLAVAGKIVSEADGDPAKFVLIDPKTGVAGPPAHVSCDNKRDAFSASYKYLQQADTTPDGDSLVLALGIHELCLVRWDPAAAKAVYATKIKDSIRLGWSERNGMKVGPGATYLGGDGVLLAFDHATGVQRDLIREADADFRVWQIQGDTVLALSWPDHDSRKLSLRAIGPDGAQRWAHRLRATDSAGRDWGSAAGPGVVVVWQTDEDSKTVVVERIDLKTGQLQDTKPATTASSIAPRVYDSLATPRRAWLLAIGDIATIDLATGAIDHT